MKNQPNLVMPSLSFFWGTKADEQQQIQDNADELMLAAIRGGMKPALAKQSVEDLFSAGWSAAVSDEAYNREDFSGN